MSRRRSNNKQGGNGAQDKSNKNANGNKGNKGNQQGGKAQKQASQKSGGNKKKRRKKAGNPKKFWGDPEALPVAIPAIRPTQEPTAVVQSMGRPPIPGQENVAQHYFQAVYSGSVQLASALAAAGDLLADDTADDEPPSAD